MSRTGRPPGRPPSPEEELLSERLPGARFSEAALSKLEKRAARAGLSRSAWCRSVLEGAALSVPELPLELRKELLATGHALNDLVYRLHSRPEPVALVDVDHICRVLDGHTTALRKARRLLQDPT